eukprot:323016-Chlamydomonas_euryale.AAC.1
MLSVVRMMIAGVHTSCARPRPACRQSAGTTDARPRRSRLWLHEIDRFPGGNAMPMAIVDVSDDTVPLPQSWMGEFSSKPRLATSA